MAASTLWLNSNSLFELTSTADWAPVHAWETDETGKRRPSTRQAVDQHDQPVWEIRVVAMQDTYGRAEETFLTLRIGSREKPTRELLSQLAVSA